MLFVWQSTLNESHKNQQEGCQIVNKGQKASTVTSLQVTEWNEWNQGFHVWIFKYAAAWGSPYHLQASPSIKTLQGP